MRERKLRQFVTDPEEASPYLDVLRSIADYQFGIGTAPCLFNSESSFTIQRSVNTWRIRNVLLDGKLFLVLRPQDGLFSITVFAAELLKKCSNPPRLRVTVNDEVIQAIMKEGNVFAKHVI
ncbi:MAG: pseudouridine synthase, partial [Metallosphaera sp.]